MWAVRVEEVEVEWEEGCEVTLKPSLLILLSSISLPVCTGGDDRTRHTLGS